MKKSIYVYAGSFDPVTVGHEDIIRRAAALCDRLLVAVMYNISKQGTFTVDERVDLLRCVTRDLPTVTVDSWDGLLVDYVRQEGADCVVRGIRGVADLESETNLAQINARLMPGLETVFLLTRPEMACVSSSAVREAGHFGADISSFVPSCILADVQAHFKK